MLANLQATEFSAATASRNRREHNTLQIRSKTRIDHAEVVVGAAGRKSGYYFQFICYGFKTHGSGKSVVGEKNAPIDLDGYTA